MEHYINFLNGTQCRYIRSLDSEKKNLGKETLYGNDDIGIDEDRKMDNHHDNDIVIINDDIIDNINNYVYDNHNSNANSSNIKINDCHP